MGTKLPLPQKGAEPPPQFYSHVCCGQMAGWIKMTLGMEVGLGPGDTVLDVLDASSPSPKRAQPPIFGPYLLWPNGWMDQDATWQGGRPQPKRHCVRWGPSSPFPNRGLGRSPLFLAYVYCGQMAGWIKMALVWRQASAQRRCVRWGPSSPSKRCMAPSFRPMSIVAMIAHLSYC